jgi:hypothetical protein
MSAGRNLDEELEAQLAGAAIPEDEVDLDGDLDFLEPSVARTREVTESNPSWALVDSQGEDASGGSSRPQGKSSSRGKKFSVRLLSPSSDSCLKIVGDGSSFCIAEMCRTNHAGSAAPLKLEHPVVVIMKQKDRAFADLTLEGRLVPAEVLERWESTTRTLNDWHEAFLAVQQQDEDMVEGEADFETRVLEVQRAELFKTPGKRRPMESQDLDAYLPYPTVLKNTGVKDQLRRNPLTFAKLGETIVLLDEGLVGLAGSFQNLLVETRESTTGFAETAKMLALKISRTNNLVGSMDVMESSDYASPTVWSSLSAMGADVQALIKKKVQLPEVDLKPLQSRVEAVEFDFKASTDKLKLQLVGLASGLGTRISRIETAVKRLNGRTGSSAIDRGLDAALRSSGGDTAQATQQEMAERIKGLEEALKETDLRLRQVMADNEADSVKFSGLGLRSELETRSWIVVNYPEMHYALIVDVYGVLEAIEDEGATNQSELLRDMKKRDDLSINGIAEGQALTAHLHEIPRIFHTASGKLMGLDSNESHLNRVPSHKHWSYGSHCLKRKLENELVKVRYSNRLVIQSYFKPGTVAYSVASEALDKSVSWVSGLISFIDRTYESLHGGSKFTAPQAWSLTTQLVRRIFSDLHTARMGTTRTMGKDRVVICTTLLWSAFKTHDAMAAFENANFEDHPSISSEYVKFLAMNSGFEALEVVTGKMKSIGDQLKDMQGSVKQADKKAENAVTHCETNKKAVEGLSRRVVTLESRK